ncbi:MAG: Small GTP-binding protein [Microgenomates group bacterium GW2011_GWC2_46_7]|nr:MAG: Small GTP-binding protein [Microgenomates group bacterium GW2011_GWC2_46_7]
MHSFKDIRNVAVIAHVDHGKTTLVDAMLKQTHTFRENAGEMSQTTILDSNTLERERGITILAKNCAVFYNETKINIIDTPGHADFSGEVERTLSMADGALLIVDAQEGPMPQTRYVLKKALKLNLKIIVVINKIDKQFARVPHVIAKIENLFLELAHDESHLEFPVLYGVGRDGKVFSKLPEIYTTDLTGNVIPLLDKIIEYFPSPKADPGHTFKMLVSSIDYNPHLGRIAIGKITQGTIKLGQSVILTNKPTKPFSVQRILLSEGLGRVEVESATTGDIVGIPGLLEVQIGLTMSDPSDTVSYPSQEITEPTLHMTLGANTSPLAGREGKFVTSRQIEERLYRELESNLSLHVEKLDNGKYKVSGRGELHLSVLLETMRREGYEMEVGKPEVIVKRDENNVKIEPVEEVDIVVPNEYQGVINQEMGKRYGILMSMEPLSETESEFVYRIPTRSIIGLRTLLLTLTKGTVLFSSQIDGYEPMGKELPKIRSGVIIASHSGDSLSYGLSSAEGRGILFIGPAAPVYEGMIVGQTPKEQDVRMNVCKGKQLTNMRSKSSDGVIQLTPPTILSLEQAIDFLENDELLEITPTSLRLRKKNLTGIENRRGMQD